MGVINPEGDGLEQFVYVGMSDQDATAIGHLPEGRGLLGALITDPHPIRLPDMSGGRRAQSGFPPNHPPMESFLGVPVRVRGDGVRKPVSDESSRRGLHRRGRAARRGTGATAGFAIENARLLAEATTRARWMTAAAELSAAILSTPTDTALDLLVNRVRDVSDAEQVTVLLIPNPQDGRLRVAAATGEAEASLRGAIRRCRPPCSPDGSWMTRQPTPSRSERPQERRSAPPRRTAGVTGPASRFRCARAPSSGACSASREARTATVSHLPRSKARRIWPRAQASPSSSRAPARMRSERSSPTTGGGSHATCTITSSSSSSVRDSGCRPWRSRLGPGPGRRQSRRDDRSARRRHRTDQDGDLRALSSRRRHPCVTAFSMSSASCPGRHAGHRRSASPVPSISSSATTSPPTWSPSRENC